MGQNTRIDKEIPTWKNGDEPDLYYQLTKQKINQLKLDDLELGYDSLQIRIWFDYSMIDYNQLLVLKYDGSEWRGWHYELEVLWNAYDLTDKIKRKKKTEITPSSGWTSLFEKLEKSKITKLPNMEDIDGLVDNWTDGSTYIVEIGTKNSYRFYSYHLPRKFMEYWQAKNMVQILSTLEEEFNMELDGNKN